MTTTDDQRSQYTTTELKKHATAMRRVASREWVQLLKQPERIIWDLLALDEAERLRSDLVFLQAVGRPLGKTACNRLARDPATRWDDLERLCWLVGESPLDYQTLWLENDIQPDPDGAWLEGFSVVR